MISFGVILEIENSENLFGCPIKNHSKKIPKKKFILLQLELLSLSLRIIQKNQPYFYEKLYFFRKNTISKIMPILKINIAIQIININIYYYVEEFFSRIFYEINKTNNYYVIINLFTFLIIFSALISS